MLFFTIFLSISCRAVPHPVVTVLWDGKVREKGQIEQPRPSLLLGLFIHLHSLKRRDSLMLLH